MQVSTASHLLDIMSITEVLSNRYILTFLTFLGVCPSPYWNCGQKCSPPCSFSGGYTAGFASQGKVPEESGHFKQPKCPNHIELLSHKNFATNTENKICWVTQLYLDWWFDRLKKPDCDPRIRWCHLQEHKLLNKSNFCVAICAFISEVCKKDGAEYPGTTLQQLVLMIQFYLEKHGLCWKLLDDNEFCSLHNTLDNLMKERCAAGLGEKHSSDAISFDAEESLWEKGILGSSSPDQLWDTLLYLVSLNFTLRSGVEHKHLCCPNFNPQLSVKYDDKGQKFLEFHEDSHSKTNQGGLSSCNHKLCVLKT